MTTDDKLTKIQEDIGDIKVTLASQHEVLKQHIKRTETLEEIVEPISKHLIEVKGAIKFIKLIGVLAGIVECVRLFIH